MGRYVKNGKAYTSQWKMENSFTENLEIELSKNRFSIKIIFCDEKRKLQLLNYDLIILKYQILLSKQRGTRSVADG